MTRWGITLPLSGVPLPAHRELVERLPDLGYTDVWTAETAGTDAFSPLVLASQWSPSLRLGTAIAPVFTRGPALLAMTAAAVAECAPGRFALGIGALALSLLFKLMLRISARASSVSVAAATAPSSAPRA